MGNKSIVSAQFTQFNSGGTGMYIKNDGYAQLVGIYGMFCDRAFVAEAAEFSDDVSTEWIDNLQDDAMSVLAENGLEPDDALEAGDMLLDLAQGNGLGNLTR